jgi:hypothetical protein
MRATAFLVATCTFAAAWLPAPASADCDAYNKDFLQFKELQDRVLHEADRINALKSLPDTDAGLCRAALALMMKANVVWRNPEPTCFEHKAQMDDFADKVHTVSTGAWKLAQTFCSDADMRRR